MHVSDAEEAFSNLLGKLKLELDTANNTTMKALSQEEQLANVVEAAKQVFDAIIKLDANATDEERAEMVTQLTNLGEVSLYRYCLSIKPIEQKSPWFYRLCEDW